MLVDKTDEPTVIHYDELKRTAYSRIHSLCCSFYGFDKCVMSSIHHHSSTQDGFTAPNTRRALPIHPSPPPPRTLTLLSSSTKGNFWWKSRGSTDLHHKLKSLCVAFKALPDSLPYFFSVIFHSGSQTSPPFSSVLCLGASHRVPRADTLHRLVRSSLFMLLPEVVHPPPVPQHHPSKFPSVFSMVVGNPTMVQMLLSP